MGVLGHITINKQRLEEKIQGDKEGIKTCNTDIYYRNHSHEAGLKDHTTKQTHLLTGRPELAFHTGM